MKIINKNNNKDMVLKMLAVMLISSYNMRIVSACYNL